MLKRRQAVICNLCSGLMASFSPLQSRTPSAAGSLSLPLLPAEPRTDKWHPESRPQQLRTGLGARGVIFFYPRPSLLSCSGPFYLCGSSHICLRGLCKHGAQQLLRCTVDSKAENSSSSNTLPHRKSRSRERTNADPSARTESQQLVPARKPAFCLVFFFKPAHS